MNTTMKRVLSVALAAVCCLLLLAGCTQKQEKRNLADAKSLADLKGAKIAAQANTFHAEAVKQIEDVNSSTYPEFADLLTALKSGSVDGYISEEPTALSITKADPELTYIHLKNNDTGFTATAADVGIAIGLKKGSELLDRINAVLAEITDDQKAQLMEQIIDVKNGETVNNFAVSCDEPAETNGILKVGMECAYDPYNWTDTENKGNGSVPISGEGKDGQYANGYDVQIARYVANKLGMKLEIYSFEWDALVPAVQSSTIDAICAGMSPTAERQKEIDFTSTYYESNLVVIIKK